MVLGCGDSSFRDSRLKSIGAMEDWGQGLMKKFLIGFAAGFATAAVIASVIIGLIIAHNNNREIVEYAEKQIEIEALREDIINLSGDELLDVPGVRGAADGAAAEFERKRDEAVQRFRSGLADR